MKNLNYGALWFLTFCVFALPARPVHGQSWFGDGDEWQYESVGWFNSGTLTIRITGDTVLDNKPCKILTTIYPSGNGYPRMAYQEEDAVFVQISSSDTFYKIYDFSLESGDLLIMPSITYLVSSTGNIDIGGMNRRYQIIKFVGGTTGHMVIEGIGMVGKPHLSNPTSCSFFYPDGDYCSEPFDGQNYYFRCFAGSGIYYSPFDDCSLVNALDDREAEDVRLYPNPVSDWLMVETGAWEAEGFKVFDLTGRLLGKGKIEDGKIDFRAYSSGVYFVEMTGRDGRRTPGLVSVVR